MKHDMQVKDKNAQFSSKTLLIYIYIFTKYWTAASSGASVIVFAPAAVTLPRSRPRPRACASEVRGPGKDLAGSSSSVPGPDKLTH